MTCTTCGAACLACTSKKHADEKAAFHKKYAAILKSVAKKLGLAKGEFEVWSNKAGVAVMGDVYLETKDRDRRGPGHRGLGLYVCVSGYHLADEVPRFFYRWTTLAAVRGAARVEHGPNQWLALAELEEDATVAVAAFRKILDGDAS